MEADSGLPQEVPGLQDLHVQQDALSKPLKLSEEGLAASPMKYNIHDTLDLGCQSGLACPAATIPISLLLLRS